MPVHFHHVHVHARRNGSFLFYKVCNTIEVLWCIHVLLHMCRHAKPPTCILVETNAMFTNLNFFRNDDEYFNKIFIISPAYTLSRDRPYTLSQDSMYLHFV